MKHNIDLLAPDYCTWLLKSPETLLTIEPSGAKLFLKPWPKFTHSLAGVHFALTVV